MNWGSVIDVYLEDVSGSLEGVFCLSDKQWVEVTSTPMTIPNTDVDSCCLATQRDIRLLVEHRASTRGSEPAHLGNNLKKV